MYHNLWKLHDLSCLLLMMVQKRNQKQFYTLLVHLVNLSCPIKNQLTGNLVNFLLTGLPLDKLNFVKQNIINYKVQSMKNIL